MTTRRLFLQSLAAIPPVLVAGSSWSQSASVNTGRLALVIGNSAYKDAPLTNPSNDARLMSDLLSQAGFKVDSLLDATRARMLAAIEQLGAALQRPEIKQVIFYYAGHGVQFDWRNYLLPVDAVVDRADQLPQRCVDLGVLLGQLGKAKDKTNIIILDACRNNPFGRTYKPKQKGLSQFDAPVGSLIAYATSPGNVASDGSGKNGLYTENLARELSQRGTRIEDALKRVRLNVRLSSSGEQIPWETTSLETDVFLFSDDQRKLTDGEIEKQLQADLEAWAKVKNSRVIDDWIAYLRDFPNGRFAEIGQVRLSRLLREREKALAAAAESERLAAEKVEAEKAAAEKLAAEKAAAEKLAAEKVAAEKLAVEKAAAEKLAAEKLAAAKLAAEKAAAEKLATAKLAAEKFAAAKLVAEKAAAEKLAAEKLAAEKLAAENAAAEKLAAEKLAAEKLAAEKAAAAASAPDPALPQPVIELSEGKPVPEIFKPSENPYSAGFYPLGRYYSVGDKAVFNVSDVFSGAFQSTFTLLVTRVDVAADRVEYNMGGNITDLMGNLLKAGGREFSVPVQFFPAEIQVGKKWTAAFGQFENNRESYATYDLQIVTKERVKVPAGEFDAFRVEGRGWNNTFGTQLTVNLWIVPGVNFPIKREIIIKLSNGRYKNAERFELVSLRQKRTSSALNRS